MCIYTRGIHNKRSPEIIDSTNNNNVLDETGEQRHINEIECGTYLSLVLRKKNTNSFSIPTGDLPHIHNKITLNEAKACIHTLSLITS